MALSCCSTVDCAAPDLTSLSLSLSSHENMFEDIRVVDDGRIDDVVCCTMGWHALIYSSLFWVKYFQSVTWEMQARGCVSSRIVLLSTAKLLILNSEVSFPCLFFLFCDCVPSPLGENRPNYSHWVHHQLSAVSGSNELRNLFRSDHSSFNLWSPPFLLGKMFEFARIADDERIRDAEPVCTFSIFSG